jgi:hypothetical protein
MGNRYFLSVLFLVTLFFLVGIIFWQQELKYALPTPIPMDYSLVPIHQKIARLELGIATNTASLLHFYNPECPCSAFNVTHIRQLIQSHGKSISIYVIVPTLQDVPKAMKEFGETVQVKADPAQQIAEACGVYSTPQAAIIDDQGRLYFRGNYNKARYCTSTATNYAELALVSLLNGAAPPSFDLAATQSYGCELKTTFSLQSFIKF